MAQVMEFLTGNIINTTTMIDVLSGTLTMANLFNPDKTQQWVSQGYNDDTLAAEITINFSETTTIDRLALKEHNLKEFHFYYNGVTANTFNLSTANTTTLSYISNSDTAQYFAVTPIDCTSVTLYMKKTQSVDSEKAVGFFYVGQNLLDLPRIPASKNYQITKKVVKITHKLSDGGIRQQKISEKWETKVKLSYISDADVTNLEDIYDRKSATMFAPFGTSTVWPGILYECVWEGDFDFWEFADNASSAGREGSIKLSETPW